MFAVKKTSLRLVAAALSYATVSAFAQTPPAAPKPAAKPRVEAKKAAAPRVEKAVAPAKSDRIMTIDELRSCMTMQKANEEEAASIKQEQADFTRDQDAIRVEQADVKKVNEEILARSTALRAEREAMNNRITELRAMAEAAKTDAEKAEYEKERDKLAERNRGHERASAEFNATQQAQSARIDALNARIGPLNERSKTVNDRVEPLQAKLTSWREQCANRRFREEEEIIIKKELANAKK
jgi:chromosome segregation ATPase